jgi:hypothetical protein
MRQQKKLLATVQQSVLLLIAFACFARGQSKWEWINPLPQGIDLTSIIHAQNRFFAVGYYGAIMSSADGAAWSRHYSGTSEILYSIAYGKGRFVAVGTHTTILSSPDGETWTKMAIQNPKLWRCDCDLNNVVYADTQFIAVGNQGTIVTSPDGVDWIYERPEITPYFFNTLRSSAYGNNRIVIAADDTVITSIDSYWETRTLQPRRLIKAIVFGNGMFVGVGFNGAVLTSTDAVAWSQCTSATSFHLYAIVFDSTRTGGQARFVAVGDSGTVVTSVNGTSWSLQPRVTHYGLKAVAGGNGCLVATGEGGGTILTSSDGIAWKDRSSRILDSMLFDVTYGNERFVAVGQAGIIMTSRGGRDWTRAVSGTTSNLHSVAYGNDRFMTVGHNIVLSSTDGISWSKQVNEMINGYTGCIAYAAGKWVIGCQTNLLYSSDGNSWSPTKEYDASDFYAISYGNGIWAATAHGGKYGNTTFMSSNLFKLDSISYSNGGDYSDKAVFCFDRFFRIIHKVWRPYDAYGDSIPYSLDGWPWYRMAVPIDNVEFTDAAFGGRTYVLAGKGPIMTSPGGPSWSCVRGTTAPLNSLAFGGGLFVGVGDNGAILVSKADTTGVAYSPGAPGRPGAAIAVVNNRIVAAMRPLGAVGAVKVDLFDIAGKRMFLGHYHPDKELLSVAAPKIPSGCYFLSISAGNGRIAVYPLPFTR